MIFIKDSAYGSDTMQREAEMTFRLNAIHDIIPNFIFGLLTAVCNNKKWITPPCPGLYGGPMLLTEYVPGMFLE